MERELPDLKRLNAEEKEKLIRRLWALIAQAEKQQLQIQEQHKQIEEQHKQIQEQHKQIQEQQERIKELEGRLKLNSQNSNKPPSSDGPQVKPKSLRERGKRPSGGQKGHKGYTLERAEKADWLVIHNPPEKCDECGKSLKNALKEEGESRQVFDIPEKIRYEVTEHQVMETRCECGKKHKGKVPEEVEANVQYGERVKALMVYLSFHQMMPLKRTAGLIGELFKMPVSQATVYKSCKEASEKLKERVKMIARVLHMKPVLNADESGLKVNKKQHWMHVAVTKKLTWIGQHVKRGQEAMKELGILSGYKGKLIHDGWNSYRQIDCKHGLCNAHHLRELTYVEEVLKQEWGREMIELLKKIKKQKESKIPIKEKEMQEILFEYRKILKKGEKANPLRGPTGKRGRTAQSKPANLILRLKEYEKDVWRFATDRDVPFTNNLAEQAIRMPKV